MLLTVDIGNTQTAIGLFDGCELVSRWRFATRAFDTADELHLNLSGQFQLAGFNLDDVDDVVVASVVPALTGCWAQVAQRVTGHEPIVVGPGIKTGLSMRYDNPAEVGADRVADALGAIDLVGYPVVVVDLGTATNMEIINEKGEFLGGIIAPGLGTGANVLATNAAKLSMVDLSCPDKAIGTNTEDAMRSGLVLGEAARIDGLVHMIFDEIGYEMPVIATGGYAGVISDLAKTVTDHEPDLTLKGLRIVYERNKKAKGGV